MVITLNQKEIESMLINGLANMGMLQGAAHKVTLIAGRSPAGMTAEIKLTPQETPPIPVGAIPRETFSGESHTSILETISEEYCGDNPDGVDAMKKEVVKPQVDPESKPAKQTKKVKSNTPLFGKDAESA